MKRKLYIIVCLIGVSFLGIGLYLVLSNDKTKLSDVGSFELINKKYIKNCLTDNCNVPDDLYAHLSYNLDNEVINKSLSTMNGNTDYYYEYITGSNFNSCNPIDYAYERSISNEFYNYINDDYITFSVNRVETNFCTNKKIFLPIEVYIYDREDEKILTQDEFIKELGYTDEALNKIVTDYLNNNDKDLVRDSYYGKALYYKSDGKLYLSFSCDEENYMSILVK